ncbi:hypothetical protein ALI144C_26895 [Actinosynnema sp. ALI-1.44]|uniref:TIGR04222 domain-containing membrane protein n=1 Tax=Actinosynnema sp. ALI-1.44 TaxID=1933779 RepID=UPI00097C857A|nr:TIGR04222 domain-containing membrane protein [Actinosynnema sp. ALI-1.44]ONI79439.1 hypothetical protein ALI144C_26895 [Actinosynnema sp. ALI-1.44]
MNPWGISGPAFLWLYGGGLAVAVIATLLLRGRLRAAGATNTRDPLTVEETALLAGGRTRMAESAIANLVDHGVVRVDRSGRLHAVRGSVHKPASTLEERLLRDITARPGRMVDYYQLRVMRLSVFDEVESVLVRRGLLVDHVGRGTVFLAASPLVVLLVVGVVRAVNGANLGSPIGYLTLLLIVTCVAAVLAMRPIKRGPTAAARKLLKRADTGGSGAAALVAHRGMAAYPDPLISKLFPVRPKASSTPRRRGGSTGDGSTVLVGGSSCGGSSSCGSSSSSGSSCGGGGGCGGGGS